MAAIHRKIRSIRRTYAHQKSAALVQRYDLIAVEDLNVAGMARGTYSRSIADAGWSTMIEMLSYKAERAGRHFIKVNARNTTQACSGCGAIVHKDLKDRIHDCALCGLSLDRDHNAALNVLHKAVVGLGALNVGHWSERAPGNLTFASK